MTLQLRWFPAVSRPFAWATCVGIALSLFFMTIEVTARPLPQHKQAEESKFPTVELAAFHDVLHPLVHEALPQKDAGRIRRGAAELAKAKKRVVKAPLPKMNEDHKKNVTELVGFLDASVDDLVKAAKQTGNDEDVLKALDAVHLEFEDLVEAINAAKEAKK
ncbi:MAG: hypothetical protein K1Y36_11920 [Blastocatellia bacterium]|nr:hypothetical protein [Blastocatellia bacterium]